MEPVELYQVLLSKMERSLPFLLDFSKENSDLSIIDFFMDLIMVCKENDSLSITFENTHERIIDFVYYFCDFHKIKLSSKQRKTLLSTLQKLIQILGDNSLMSNLEKGRFKFLA
jgi:hypothetical protein